ncbi:MAG: GSCFA domain-containing protein [Bacteroidota bacterium]
MNLMLQPEVKPSSTLISYTDKQVLIGSCFSDNIGAKLQEAKFQTLFNPTGIVFDPISLARHLSDYAINKQYGEEDVFQQNELWHSWQHHSDFSTTSQEQTINGINAAIRATHHYLQSTGFLFITLGTAFSYQLRENYLSVANCHKAPKEWFDKKLLSVSDITEALREGMNAVRKLNPSIKIVLTVSPVKHLRDGIIENNRSKARLIEAVHQLSETESNCSYFPAYELVTDVLRDYRFYAKDMAHPSEQAIQFVFEHFCGTFLAKETQQLMQEVLQIVAAKNHRPLHPDTQAHQQFLKTFLAKATAMKAILPMIDWEEMIHYFGNTNGTPKHI